MRARCSELLVVRYSDYTIVSDRYLFSFHLQKDRKMSNLLVSITLSYLFLFQTQVFLLQQPIQIVLFGRKVRQVLQGGWLAPYPVDFLWEERGVV